MVIFAMGLNEFMAIGRRGLTQAAASVALLVGLTAAADANPIGGLQQNWGAAAMLFLMLIGLYEAVVILIEAGVYCWALRLRYGQALWFSAVANAASFAAGLIVMGAFGGIANSVLGRFIVACLVEVPVLYLLMLRRIRSDGTRLMARRVILAGLGANVLTHGLTLLLIRGF